mgnify:CR=1 FL=1
MSKEKFDYFIKTENNNWEVIIGLEVHAQVISNSKLFSGSSTKFGGKPNTQVSLVDSAFPGMLPVMNEFCIKHKKFLIVGAISKFDGHLFVFNFNKIKSPCLRCFYQNMPPDETLNCEANGWIWFDSVIDCSIMDANQDCTMSPAQETDLINAQSVDFSVSYTNLEKLSWDVEAIRYKPQVSSDQD